jgi:hypothetical protein
MLGTGRRADPRGCVCAGKPATSIEDSWEAFNAKLTFEKHLQDLNLDNSEPEEDVFSDFGEIVPPAHTNNSPRPIRPAMKKHSTLLGSGMATGNGHSQGGSSCNAGTGGIGVAPLSSPNKRADHSKRVRKSVHIKTQDALPSPPPTGHHVTTFKYSSSNPSNPVSNSEDMFAGINGTGSDLDRMEGTSPAHSNNASYSPEHHAEFVNKRTGHYNEFKVLQAMRAKLMEDEDESEVEA